MSNPATTPETARAAPAARIQTYAEFWLYYLQEHSKLATRVIHEIGTAGVIYFLVTGLVFLQPWHFLYAPLCGYGAAWFSHFLIEKNRPATFKYPLWSLGSDFKMFFLAIVGKLGPHLDKAGVKH